MVIKKVWNKLALAVALITTTTCGAFAADIVVFTTPGYEAAIKSLSAGTTILVNDGTLARIGITGNGGVITWKTLNIPAGKTLDFFFSQDGQVALNNVLSGMSKFAGTLSSSGARGNVVISNPNGVIIDNTGVVNGGNFFFTTHAIDSWDGNLDGEIYTKRAKGIDGKYHGITINPGASITTQNFTLASSGDIAVKGGNILATKNVCLITSDGVTYSAGLIDGYYSSLNTNSKITIANASIKTSDGKIILIGDKGAVQVNGSTFSGDTSIASKNDTKIYKSSFGNKLKVDSFANVDLQEVGVGGDADLRAAMDLQYASYLLGYSSFVGGNLTVNSGNYALVNNVTITGDTNITSTGDADFVVSKTANLYMNATRDAGVWSSTINNNAKLIGKNVTVDQVSGAGLPVILGTLDATATEKITLFNNVLQSEIAYPLRGNLSAPALDIRNFKFRATPPQDKNEAATYVNRLAVGSAPNTSFASPVFTPKGFAAEDVTDYKEQFLRKYVKKPGNIVTTSIFKAE